MTNKIFRDRPVASGEEPFQPPLDTRLKIKKHFMPQSLTQDLSQSQVKLCMVMIITFISI